jgi:hypothetical protein
MHPSFDPDAAVAKLAARPERLICEGLLDQHILAGWAMASRTKACL